MSDHAERAFAALKAEIEALRVRAAVSDEDIAHLNEIKRISFMLWYDPDNEACGKWGRELEKHIAPLCVKFSTRQP